MILPSYTYLSLLCKLDGAKANELLESITRLNFLEKIKYISSIEIARKFPSCWKMSEDDAKYRKQNEV